MTEIDCESIQPDSQVGVLDCKKVPRNCDKTSQLNEYSTIGESSY